MEIITEMKHVPEYESVMEAGTKFLANCNKRNRSNFNFVRANQRNVS